ncbi:MAG: pyridoxamine 5'-phosphate oxidase family protein [Aquabacterium sp.]
MFDDSNRTKLWDLIKDIRFAMFTTHHANGHLHGRPMTLQNRAIDEDDTLWFFMSRESEPVQDIGRDSEVNVSFCNPDKQDYVSVSGHAQVVDDTARKHRLWSKLNEAWFPQGPDSPDVALVKVTITHADYWDTHHNKLVQLFDMAKAAITGKPPTDIGDRGHVRLN